MISIISITHTSMLWLYSLSLHDALPISFVYPDKRGQNVVRVVGVTSNSRRFEDENRTLQSLRFETGDYLDVAILSEEALFRDRKSTRLNSSHLVISYAVFCLKKKIHTTV